jgi:hypothetical protein
MAEKEVQDTADYKLSKTGRKIRAHRIIFNKGDDDGKKGITEMKKTYKAFVEQHTAELTEEQKDEIIAELTEALSGDLSAGEWIRDFVKSDNPKFEGKSKEKRKQMALAAYYAKQRNEEAEIEEAYPGYKEKGKALDASVKKIQSNLDVRTRGKELDVSVKKIQSNLDKRMKKEEAEIQEELKGNQHKLDKNKNGKLDKHDFKLLRKEENMEESVFDWKNKARQTSDSSKTKTYHDVKKTSTGTVYTKQFDKDGVSKGTGDDAAKKAEGAAKRGRGRPKKDKFAEAVEFLLALSEESFDDMMEEGFDVFLEEFEQLDELSKTTLGSYIKMATNKIPSGLAVNAHQAGAEPTGSKARKGFLAKANKRIDGIAKATDRLTK